MWKKEIKNLKELRTLLVEEINYCENEGFTYHQFNKKTELLGIIEIYGEPTEKNLEYIQQQTLKYKASIGRSDGYIKSNFELLFWAFNKKPLKIIRFHLSYVRTGGKHAEKYIEFINLLFTDIVNKFGIPTNKTMRLGKEELLYQRKKHKLYFWNNSEGLRVEIKW